MSGTVARWGKSLAIRLPKAIAEKANLSEGDAIELRVTRQGRVVIESVRRQVDFGALYQRINPENQYPEVLTGAALGGEVGGW